MSSITNPQPEHPAAEELVAYLDGELPADECRRVEARLAADDDYRQQLRDLDRTWQALDALPQAKPDADFARTTMELVTVAAEGELSQHTVTAAARRGSRLRRCAAVGAVAATACFAGVWGWLAWRENALLADLPVIRQVDLLAQIENSDFLRQMSETVPLDQLVEDEAAVEDELLQLEWAGAESYDARRKWLEALSPAEEAKLAAKAKRFGELEPHERARLRELHRDIRRNDPELQKTLLAYGQWLGRLTPGEAEQLREALYGLSTQEQVERVQEFVWQESRRALRRLSADDVEKLRREVLQIADQRRTEIQHDMRRRGENDRVRRLDGPLARVALIILSRELQDDDRDNQTRQRLVDQLSPEAQAHLDQLSRWRRRLVLWQWIRDSLQTRLGPDELEHFFVNELDHSQREQLLDLPAGEMQAQLERLYFGAQLGLRDTDSWMEEPPARPRNPPRGAAHEFQPQSR